MQLEQCPHCKRRVVLSPDGECPACRQFSPRPNAATSSSVLTAESTAAIASPEPQSTLAREDPQDVLLTSQNPYASPLAILNAADNQVAGPPAKSYPLVPRFWAAQIDFLCSIVLGIVVAKQLDEYGLPVQIAAAVVVYFAYFFVAELLFAATVGKWTMGIIVARRNGERPSAGQAFVRNLIRLLESNPALALPGSLIIILTKDKQRLGDLLAGTIVVRR